MNHDERMNKKFLRIVPASGAVKGATKVHNHLQCIPNSSPRYQYLLLHVCIIAIHTIVKLYEFKIRIIHM